MIFNRTVIFSLLVIAAGSVTAHAALTPVVVPYASRFTVDSDGDSVPDLFDNAPGLANDQADLDADGIGDVIDPTPVMSNPFLGDPGLGLFDPAPTPAGSHVFLSYTLSLATPPGAWGHIDLDFGGDGTFDATYFGPLSTFSIDSIDVAPSLYSAANWDLNTPGTYSYHAKAFGPGMSSQNDSIVDNVVITAAPEPASLLLLTPLLLLTQRKNKKAMD